MTHFQVGSSTKMTILEILDYHIENARNLPGEPKPGNLTLVRVPK